MIKEIIVVEGRDDITAVKSALDCEVIATGGYAYGKRLLSVLKKAQSRRGVIIFTDPDYMGEKIRADLSKKLPHAKHAFLPQRKATKNHNIGIENASPKDIREAIFNAKALEIERKDEFTIQDLRRHQLVGFPGSNNRRKYLSEILGIGYGNGKQFLKRLNGFGITREEFEKGCERLETRTS
ncbi:MAG: ribonuclease M5 [Tissierellia bacterium]|nr:ribonuclease M5 [Tissierellia bacterium]